MWGIEASLKRENMVHNHQDEEDGEDKGGDGVDARANNSQLASETAQILVWAIVCCTAPVYHTSSILSLGVSHTSSLVQINRSPFSLYTIIRFLHTKQQFSSSHGCSVILRQS